MFDLPPERLPPGAAADAGISGDWLLIVATDRLSAFDVVLPDPIPGKGEMLCQISNFWFGKTGHIVPNHLTGIDVAAVLPAGVDPEQYTGWAFGMGPARMALARYGIPDIRTLYDSDVRFLRQFAR